MSSSTSSNPATRSALAVAVGAALIATAGVAASGATSSSSPALGSAPAHIHMHHDGEDGPQGRERTFRVNGDRLAGRARRPVDARIWKRFARLIPAEQRRHIRQFTVVPGDEGAFVAPIGQRGRVWQLGVSQGLARDGELDYVLVHEFGHLLTLKAAQVPPQQGRRRPCKTYNPGEGCALPQSYIAQYFNEFWRATGLAPQWGKIQRIRNENRYERAMTAFYKRNKTAFVTDYAPSAPAEDIAESFAFFVTEPPNADATIAGEKVRFFERFPELVALRDQIRQRGGLQ